MKDEHDVELALAHFDTLILGFSSSTIKRSDTKGLTYDAETQTVIVVHKNGNKFIVPASKMSYGRIATKEELAPKVEVKPVAPVEPATPVADVVKFEKNKDGKIVEVKGK